MKQLVLVDRARPRDDAARCVTHHRVVAPRVVVGHRPADLDRATDHVQVHRCRDLDVRRLGVRDERVVVVLVIDAIVVVIGVAPLLAVGAVVVRLVGVRRARAVVRVVRDTVVVGVGTDARARRGRAGQPRLEDQVAGVALDGGVPAAGAVTAGSVLGAPPVARGIDVRERPVLDSDVIAGDVVLVRTRVRRAGVVLAGLAEPNFPRPGHWARSRCRQVGRSRGFRGCRRTRSHSRGP